MVYTSPALDEAYIQFQKVKDLTRRMAEIETSIYRLAQSIKKAQKRANALRNIVIPGFDSTIRTLSLIHISVIFRNGHAGVYRRLTGGHRHVGGIGNQNGAVHQGQAVAGVLQFGELFQGRCV